MEAVQIAEASLPPIALVVGSVSVTSVAQLLLPSATGEGFFGAQRWVGRPAT